MKTTINKDRSLRIFLSYSDHDAVAAKQLRRLLIHQHNTEVFSRDSLSAGEDWVATLKKGLTNCDVFVVLVSRNVLENPWVLQELGAAWALEKPKLIVLLQPEFNVLMSQLEPTDQVLSIQDIEGTDILERALSIYHREDRKSLLLAS